MNVAVESYITLLREDQLRRLVLLPLLGRMGLKEVIEYHGSSAEKGKDILCYYLDPTERRRYVSLVVKRGDIHGSVSKRGNAGEVLNQVEQSFNEPYTDVYGLNEVSVDEVWIVASGRIKNTAVESIRGKLLRYNYSRFLRFFDRALLAQLLVRFYPEFPGDNKHFSAVLHQVRAAVTSSQNYLQRMRRLLGEAHCVENKSKIIELADRVSDEISNVNALAEVNVLFFEGIRVPRNARLNLMDILRNLVGEIRGTSRKDRIEITSKLESVWINADKQSLRFALRAILDNALRYSKGIVRITIASAGPHLEVCFEDFGIGIVKGDEHSIFDPFYRSESARRIRVGGTGLSLYVARNILNAHQGDLALRRSFGPTEFVLTIPAAEEVLSEAEPPERQRNGRR